MGMMMCCVILSTFLVYVLQMFRKLHNGYDDVLCNPFYIPGICFTDVQEVTQCLC